MKVLLAGHLAKPQLLPLTSMIQQASPDVAFEVAGPWLSESDELTGDFPKRVFPPYLLAALRRTAGPSQNVAVPKNLGGNKNGATVARSARAPRPAKFSNACMTSLLYVYRELVYRVDAWKAAAKEREIIGEFDVFNLHSAFPSIALHRRRLIVTNTPLVVSLWGSDVLRNHDPVTIRNQQEVLNQATLITYTTNLFKEAALAKYGRHLTDKFRETFFSANELVFQRAAKIPKSDASAALREKYDIPADRVIICVGHNASPDNQHLAAIASLKSQASEIRDRIFVLLPMTYCQTEPSLMGRVRDALRDAGMMGRVLTEFMSIDDIVELRKGADMLVYVPVSDVFSATVSQALIGQQVVISGSWLPYQQRQRAGFRFWEVDRVGDVGPQVAELLSDWHGTVQAVQQNEQIGIEFFDPERIGGQWADVYREAIELKRQSA